MSVESPPQVSALPPTLFIGSRRARLLTFSAALRSPQTCFRLPHCPGCFAACGFPRPPALRRADYRLPPVIVLPLWILLIVVVLVCLRHCCTSRACASVVLLLVVIILLYCYIKDFNCLSPYIVLLLYGILRLLIIPAFGEILRQWYAEVRASPSLSGTRYGPQRHQGAKGGKWYARQTSAKPRQTRILYAPNRRGDKRPGTSLRLNVSAVRRTINIIYRDCVTGCRGPNPSTSFRYRTQSGLC